MSTTSVIQGSGITSEANTIARTYRFYEERRDGYTALVQLVTDTVLQPGECATAFLLDAHRRGMVAGHGVLVETLS